jgi:hypothetical protein
VHRPGDGSASVSSGLPWGATRVVDSAAGRQLIAQTEQALGQSDQQRRAQDVKNASKQNKAPSL